MKMKLEGLLRTVVFSIAACAVGLGLLAASGYAQNTQSRTFQKENSMTQTTATQPKNDATANTDAIRPFRVSIPEEALTDLRRRIVSTQWPEHEHVAGASPSLLLATN